MTEDHIANLDVRARSDAASYVVNYLNGRPGVKLNVAQPDKAGLTRIAAEGICTKKICQGEVFEGAMWSHSGYQDTSEFIDFCSGCSRSKS